MSTYAVIDFETTGLLPSDRPIEIAVVLVSNDGIKDRYQSLMNPGVHISSKAQEVTGITNEMVRQAPSVGDVMKQAMKFVGSHPIVAHNAAFDHRFWDAELQRIKLHCHQEFTCSLLLSRRIFPDAPNHKLETLIQMLRLPNTGRSHRALADAEATAHLFLRLQQELMRRFQLTNVSHELLLTIQGKNRSQLEDCVRDYRNDLAKRKAVTSSPPHQRVITQPNIPEQKNGVKSFEQKPSDNTQPAPRAIMPRPSQCIQCGAIYDYATFCPSCKIELTRFQYGDELDQTKGHTATIAKINTATKQTQHPAKIITATAKPASSQPPEPQKKKWGYDRKTRVLRNNNTGMEYFPKDYEYQRSSNTSGYQILHGPDEWVNHWDIDYANRYSPPTAIYKPSSKVETANAEIQNIAGFAKELCLPIDMLLEQLRAAGVGKMSGSDTITEHCKAQLLEHWRNKYKPTTTTTKLSPKAISASDSEAVLSPASHSRILQQTKAFPEQDDLETQHDLGVLYLDEQDFTQELMWYREAAKRGNATAQLNLGVICCDVQDYSKALIWFRRAAAQGAGMAQYNLGTMYADGRSVPQDYTQAMMWYLIAKAGGITLAEGNLLQLEAHSTTAQIAEAKRMAQEWMAAHLKKN